MMQLQHQHNHQRQRLQQRQMNLNPIRVQSSVSLKSSSSWDSIVDIEKASERLLWETLQRSNNRPVLDLSAKRESMLYMRDAETKDAVDNHLPRTSSGQKTPKTTTNEKQERDGIGEDSSTWDQGQLWNVTRHRLFDELEVSFSTSNEFLLHCPQLVRLEPAMILETAHWIRHELGNDFLFNTNVSRVLSFPCSNVSYGFEFISQMMMIKPPSSVKPFLLKAPELLLSGIEGGLQEQAVKQALGNAGEATNKASQKLVGDTVALWNAIQAKKRPKGL